MGETQTSEQLEQRLRTLRADVAAAEQEEQAAAEHAREALVVGDDAAEFIRARNEAQTRAVTLRETVASVEALVVMLREAEGRKEAERRMLGIKRAYTSLLDQRAKDVERIVQASAALVEDSERLPARHRDLDALLAEALVLHERFGVALPDLPRPVRPASETRIVKALQRVREVTLPETPSLPRRLADLPYRGALWSVRRVLERVAGTPTGELLERTGLGLLGDAEGWEARGRTKHNKRRDQGDAARRSEIERYDVWLQIRVSEPALVDALRRQSKQAGLRFDRDASHPGQSIREAADRLGVIGVEKSSDGPVWWALPGAWDEARFSLLATSRRSLAGLRG